MGQRSRRGHWAAQDSIPPNLSRCGDKNLRQKQESSAAQTLHGSPNRAKASSKRPSLTQQGVPPELLEVIKRWFVLGDDKRQAILAIVRGGSVTASDLVTAPSKAVEAPPHSVGPQRAKPPPTGSPSANTTAESQAKRPRNRR